MQSASVARYSRTLPILTAAALLLGLGGCATAPHWGVSGGDRDRGVVRLSYEYPEFHQPALSDAQAMKTAVSRCNGWGYDDAKAIEGQLRQCSDKNGANCTLWMVTREYQCTDNAAFAGNLAK